MTMRRNLCLQIFLWLSLLVGSPRLSAQDFGLLTTSSPAAPVVNGSLTFDLVVTNTSPVAQTNITVVHTLPASVNYVSSTQDFGSLVISGRVLTFRLDWLFTNETTRISIITRPTTFGTFTNRTSISSTNAVALTNEYEFTVFSAAANLGVTLSGFASGVLSNDWTSYTLAATNYGPSTAANVVLSNLLPTGVKFISITPSNSTINFATNQLTIRLASLGIGGGTSYRVMVQPTNAGAFEILAGISAPGLRDTNSADNAAAGSLAVSNYLTGMLIATVVSPQVFNRQTGLIEQTIRLSNIGDTDVGSARVIVQGLTNLLFNAVGTNNGSPFVVYANPLAAGASVDLLLEYFVPTRLAVPDPTLQALEVPVVDSKSNDGTAPDVRYAREIIPGKILVEFDSVAGRTYTVLYGDDPSTTNAAQPTITATANRTQWIDSGPPKTISVPGSSRFYRVRQNP